MDRTRNGISLCQIKYALDLILDASIIGVKPCNIPTLLHMQLHNTYGKRLLEPTAYMTLIGRLLYLTHFKHEIAYIVSKINQFIDGATDKHILVGLHVLRYLKKSSLKLIFNVTLYIMLRGFFNFVWGHVLTHEDQPHAYVYFLENLS